MIGGIPLYHVAAMYLCIACVGIGGTNLLEYVPDPAEILKFTQEDKVTIWVWPPTLYINLPFIPNFDKLDFSSLKICIVFGALCPPAVLDRWRKRLPSTQFLNYYGQTEMSPLVPVYRTKISLSILIRSAVPCSAGAKGL